MSKKQFDMPAYMVGIDNEDMVILTTFSDEGNLIVSLRIDHREVLRLISVLSASINANCDINVIKEIDNE